MALQIRMFWTNLAVGILGLIVGIDYLIKWTGDDFLSREFIIGSLCTILALSWLIYVFVKRNNKGWAA